MSVKLSLLALLSEGPSYGAALRSRFEEATGGAWPLNVGQVYTTLGRLERDGLVEVAGPPDDEGRIAYRLTDAGRAEVAGWWTGPVGRAAPPRSELAMKLALALTLPEVDVAALVHAQRTATMAGLRDLTRTKAALAEAAETDDEAFARLVVVENSLYAIEAETRWLDAVEARLARRGRSR